MLYSMTGFGRAEKVTETQRIIIEIKSINSKGLDLRTRVSNLFQSKEIELRKQLTAQLERGKIDLTLVVESTEDNEYDINAHAFNSYCNKLMELSSNQGINRESLLSAIMRLPGVVVQNMEEVREEDWAAVLEVLEVAVGKLQAYRAEEGEVTEKDIIENIQKIQELLEQVNPHEQARIDKIKNRLLQSLEDLSLSNQVNENRLEQEMIFYLDKFDLNEEKIRLEQHCKYFLEQLEEEEKNKSVAKGKKLGFILQEMGREINTLGSKANSASIQKIVILMKNHADKIKEQLANIL